MAAWSFTVGKKICVFSFIIIHCKPPLKGTKDYFLRLITADMFLKKRKEGVKVNVWPVAHFYVLRYFKVYISCYVRNSSKNKGCDLKFRLTCLATWHKPPARSQLIRLIITNLLCKKYNAGDGFISVTARGSGLHLCTNLQRHNTGLQRTIRVEPLAKGDACQNVLLI